VSRHEREGKKMERGEQNKLRGRLCDGIFQLTRGQDGDQLLNILEFWDGFIKFLFFKIKVPN
jgi:hypothetical protein